MGFRISDWFDGKSGRNGNRSYKFGNIMTKDDKIYSYGEHFCIGYFAGNIANGKRLFLYNADKYASSRTTPRHQNEVRYMLNKRKEDIEVVTLSFSSLVNMGIRRDLTSYDILDYTQPTSIPVVKIKNVADDSWDYYNYELYDEYGHVNDISDKSKLKNYTKFEKPRNGEFRQIYSQTAETLVFGEWHTAEHVLLRLEVDRSVKLYEDDVRRKWVKLHLHYLCGFDEGNYFISELSGEPYTVKDAIQDLKPLRVKQAEEDGIKVPRQGEWFFVPVSYIHSQTLYADKPPYPSDIFEYGESRIVDKKELNGMPALKVEREGLYPSAKKFLDDGIVKHKPLPYSSDTRNLHRVSVVKSTLGDKGEVLEGHTLVFGDCKHTERGSNKKSGEHATVELGNELHFVFKNTELRSFGSNHKVD